MCQRSEVTRHTTAQKGVDQMTGSCNSFFLRVVQKFPTLDISYSYLGYMCFSLGCFSSPWYSSIHYQSLDAGVSPLLSWTFAQDSKQSYSSFLSYGLTYKSMQNIHFFDSTNSGGTYPSQLAYILLSHVPSCCQVPVHGDPTFRKTHQVLLKQRGNSENFKLWKTWLKM